MGNQSSRDRLLDATFFEVYRYGYAGAGIAAILKEANVPKGSMYHYFRSKKELVMAMIEERLIPKVRDAFLIELHENSKALDILQVLFKKIAHNEMLIQYGCPLHKILCEVGALDDEITELCYSEYRHLVDQLSSIIILGQKQHTIRESEPKALAEFIILSSWGALSRPPKYASKAQFLKDTQPILAYITR